MLAIQIEKFNDLAVVECKGRIVRSETVFALRDAVLSQAAARTIALDLSEVKAIGGGGLGMLAFLQHWADERKIEFKLFSPSRPVLTEIERTRSIARIDVASLHEMMGILADAERSYSLAA